MNNIAYRDTLIAALREHGFVCNERGAYIMCYREDFVDDYGRAITLGVPVDMEHPAAMDACCNIIELLIEGGYEDFKSLRITA